MTKRNGSKQYHKICAYCGKEVVYTHKHRPKNCPFCDSGNWHKPDTEIELFLLQRKFIENGDRDALGKMYLILRNYARSMILKMISGKFQYEPDLLEEKASDAANRLLEYYLSREGFEIENSFAGYLRWKIKEVMYEFRDEEDHESLNQHLKSAEDKELMDTAVLMGMKPLYPTGPEIKPLDDQEDVVSTVEWIIGKALEIIRQEEYSSRSSILAAIGIYNTFIKKPETFMSRFYLMFGQQAKDDVDRIVMEVERTLTEMMEESGSDHS